MSGSATIIGYGEGIGAAAVRGFAADASEEASLLAGLGAACAAFGAPTSVVYNAAHWRPGPALSLPAASWELDHRICVVGAVVAADWAAARMRPAGAGSILLTGGGIALHPSPAAPTLSVGKPGLRALALLLADELAPEGLRVGTVTVAGTVGPDGIAPERVAAG